MNTTVDWDRIVKGVRLGCIILVGIPVFFYIVDGLLPGISREEQVAHQQAARAEQQAAQAEQDYQDYKRAQQRHEAEVNATLREAVDQIHNAARYRREQAGR
jgi:hypothetical protein